MLPSALILDRDGTLIAMSVNPHGEQDSAYFPEELEFFPDVASLLLPFVRANIPIVIATNQPGVAKGHFSEQDLVAFHLKMTKELEASGIPIRAIYSCLHHPVGEPAGDQRLVGDCDCRKPKPGMILQAASEVGFDLQKAIFIGDSDADAGAARLAGVGRFFRVRTFVSERVPLEKRRVQLPDAPMLEGVLKAILRDGFSAR